MRQEKMEGIKIAIIFGDNDFRNTFYGVLNFLYDAFKHTGSLPTDKSKLQFLINSISPICYVSHQNQWKYNGLENVENNSTEMNKQFLHIKKYVGNINIENILVNEEVDKYLSETDWNNFETFILDTYLDDDNVYSV